MGSRQRISRRPVLWGALAWLPLAWIGRPSTGHAADAASDGVVQVVEGAATLDRAGTRYRVVTNASVASGDRFRTGADSSLTILFADDTYFDIGPNADLVVDDFVFDPDSFEGLFRASMVAGSFRFVTGLIAAGNPEAMELSVPGGILGIRGTHVAGEIADGETEIVLLEEEDNAPSSALELRNAQGRVQLRRPGFAARLRRGAAPDAARELRRERLQELLRRGRLLRRLRGLRPDIAGLRRRQRPTGRRLQRLREFLRRRRERLQRQGRDWRQELRQLRQLRRTPEGRQRLRELRQQRREEFRRGREER